MPAGDRTRPMGMGPRTGRGAGYCAGHGVPGYANPIPGRGFGCRGVGRGAFVRGRGYRHWYYATGLPFWARQGTYALPIPFAAPFCLFLSNGNAIKVSDIMTKNLLAVGPETSISQTQAFWVLGFEEFRNNCGQ